MKVFPLQNTKHRGEKIPKAGQVIKFHTKKKFRSDLVLKLLIPSFYTLKRILKSVFGISSN